jgi:hypothetical protein
MSHRYLVVFSSAWFDMGVDRCFRFAGDDGTLQRILRCAQDATATADPYGMTNKRTGNGKGKYRDLSTALVTVRL